MPRHPPNALTSRLRVRTTNDNIGINGTEDGTSITVCDADNLLSQLDNIFVAVTI
jgi:hypothetical protein